MTTRLLVSKNTPTPLDVRRQRRETFHMARRIIGSLVNDLRQIDQQLGTLAAAIPKPGEQFELLEEVGDGVRCVRGDLLADAIETLESLAYLDDDALCRRHAERQRLLPEFDE